VALLTEAGLWDVQSAAIGKVGSAADSLRFGQTGCWARYLPGYYTLVDAIVARCHEGVQRMAENGDTLRSIAKAYEETEVRHSQVIQSAGQSR
jgi:hypothetical protein